MEKPTTAQLAFLAAITDPEKRKVVLKLMMRSHQKNPL